MAGSLHPLTPRSLRTALLRMALRQEPRMTADMLTVFRAWAEAISVERLVEGIKSRSVDAVLAAVNINGNVDPLLKRVLVQNLRRVFAQSAQATAIATKFPPPPVAASSAAGAAPQVALEARFNLANPRALRWAEKQTATRVGYITRQAEEAVRNLVLPAFRTGGAAPLEVARQIRDVIGLHPDQEVWIQNFRRELLEGNANALTRRLDAVTLQKVRGFLASETPDPGKLNELVATYRQSILTYRSQAIARSELITGSGAGQNELWRQARDDGLLDDSVNREWLVSPKACENICLPMKGQIVGLDEPFITGEGEEVDGPGEPHPHCFPGDTMVRLPSPAVAAFRRRYDGEVVTVEIAGGEKFTCTPNHPVLTPGGWVAAGLLDEGASVVRCTVPKRVVAVDHHHQDRPARIQDVAESLGGAPGMSAREVPVAAEDFHGDGKGSEVAVVVANRFLRHRLDAERQQHPAQLHFVLAAGLAALLHCLGALRLLLDALRATPHRPMRRLHVAQAFAGGHVAPPDPLGLGDVPGPLSVFPEDALNHGSVDAELTGEVEHRNSIAEGGNDESGIEGDAPATLRDLRRRGVYDEGRVVGVHRSLFSGDVFNLETESGYYLAGTVVVHNCTCGLRLVVDAKARAKKASGVGVSTVRRAA